MSADWWTGGAPVVRPLIDLLLAGLLCSLIGLEREMRRKDAGVRTLALVGLGTALFTEVSKWGFLETVGRSGGTYDPARIAAQVVTGIGFLGGGLIFVRRDTVRGLTTAAAVWTSCAVGMACGAGLWLLAVAVTVLHALVVFGFPFLQHRLGSTRYAPLTVEIEYQPGTGVLPRVLNHLSDAGCRLRDADLVEEAGDDGELTVVRLVVADAAAARGALEEVKRLPGVEAVRISSQTR